MVDNYRKRRPVRQQQFYQDYHSKKWHFNSVETFDHMIEGHLGRVKVRKDGSRFRHKDDVVEPITPWQLNDSIHEAMGLQKSISTVVRPDGEFFFRKHEVKGRIGSFSRLSNHPKLKKKSTPHLEFSTSPERGKKSMNRDVRGSLPDIFRSKGDRNSLLHLGHPIRDLKKERR